MSVLGGVFDEGEPVCTSKLWGHLAVPDKTGPVVEDCERLFEHYFSSNWIIGIYRMGSLDRARGGEKHQARTKRDDFEKFVVPKIGKLESGNPSPWLWFYRGIE